MRNTVIGIGIAFLLGAGYSPPRDTPTYQYVTSSVISATGGSSSLTDLTFLAVANGVYSFQMVVDCTAGTTADGVTIAGPAGSSSLSFQMLGWSGTSTPANVRGTTYTTYAVGGTIRQQAIFTGIIINGSTAGNVTFAWFRNTSGPTSSLFAGTYVVWKKMN
jgi:hypothetical protein